MNEQITLVSLSPIQPHAVLEFKERVKKSTVVSLITIQPHVVLGFKGRMNKSYRTGSGITESNPTPRCLGRAPSVPLASAFVILIRFLSAGTTCVGDCDETFNYWEPLHYLLYGFGFQTW